MRLIIDIPKNEYRHIKEIYEKNDIVESTYSYIYHGTPLDDIKEEIDELDFDFGDYDDHTDEIHEMINKVWNKHIGKRSRNEQN